MFSMEFLSFGVQREATMTQTLRAIITSPAAASARITRRRQKHHYFIAPVKVLLAPGV
jgi:hypothetical protein